MKYYQINAKSAEDLRAEAESAWLSYDANFSEDAADSAKLSHDEFVAQRVEMNLKAEAHRRDTIESVDCFDDFFATVPARVEAEEDTIDIERDLAKLQRGLLLQAKNGEIPYTMSQIDMVASYLRRLIRAMKKGFSLDSSSEETTEKSSTSSAAAAFLFSFDAESFEQHMLAHDDDGFVYHPVAMPSGRKAPRDRGAKSPLAAARIAAGLTQAQLAERVGCKQVEISRWENDVFSPSIPALRKLSSALACSIDDLIDD